MSMSQPKSYPMVRITLSLAIQNKVLRALNSALGINESYPEPHVITMKPRLFGEFVAACAELEDPPSLKQLKVEKVDLLKEPRRTVIKYRGHGYSEDG